MSAHLRRWRPRLVPGIVLMGISLALPALAEPARVAGEIVLAAGPAAIRQGESEIPATRGYKLQPGQTIVTGEGAFVHVRMADGGMVAVRPFSVFQIDVFDYRHDTATDRVRYRLEEGVARSITGAVGESNKEAFRLNTPVAAVGVRGTDFVVATDAGTSRVAVNSGAVIVAALGGQCAADGFGTCASGGLLLGAGQGTDGRYVEVVRGEQLPRLVQDPDSSPDQLQRPHPQEPVAVARLPADSPSERLRNDNPKPLAADPVAPPAIDPPGQPGTPSESGPPIVTPPPGVELPSLAAMPKDVYWGRWSSGAGVDASSAARVSELVAQKKGILIVNSVYGAGLDNMARQLPRSGFASFAAAGGEGVFVGAEGATALAVQSGALDVNFDSRTFATTSTFSGAGNTYDTAARGIINDRGYLQSTPAQSNSRVTGALGAGLESAVTTVERDYVDGSLSGVIGWGKR
ncbi:hypothetical protein FOZ76_13965 [Verticiella sediminum]|uniref:FecR protein domain-containing protein n=1 Tax=Verticiella sediminum TaxID=1247510 RepID=A0A556AKE5_9BURK|nr:FecR domain-containing protein [Verticiella sediminum]TSH93367.1 hypothetical protein FOZ76_13965 [Verticiella sediminum]